MQVIGQIRMQAPASVMESLIGRDADGLDEEVVAVSGKFRPKRPISRLISVQNRKMLTMEGEGLYRLPIQHIDFDVALSLGVS